jgi:hypothetical protein
MIFRARTWTNFVRHRPGLVQPPKLNLWPSRVLRGTVKRSDRRLRFTVPVPIVVVTPAFRPPRPGKG